MSVQVYPPIGVDDRAGSRTMMRDQRGFYRDYKTQMYLPLPSPLLVNLTSWWKGDEASGNAIDAINGNTLADNNTVTSAAGKVGTSRQFTLANSEFLSIADNASLSAGDTDFALGGWFYLDTKATTQFMIAKHDDTSAAGGEYALFYDTAVDRFTFAVFQGAGTVTVVVANVFGAVATATWHHVVAWHDSVANVIGIEVNDGTPNTAAHTVGCNDTATQFQLSGSSIGTKYFNGRMDECFFARKVFTAAERTLLYGGGAGTTPPF